MPETHSRAARIAHLTWPRVAILMAMLSFSAFVLWLTASSFDKSEMKSLLMLMSGFIVREFLPLVRKLLGPMTETFDGHID